MTKFKENSSKKKLRNFGLLIGLVFPIIFGWLLPYMSGHDFRVWTLFIGFPSLIIGLIKPNILIYPYKVWMALGNFLGFINSKLILSIVFISVLLPSALFMKLFGYDPLRQKKSFISSYKENNKNHKIDFTRIF